MKGSLLALKPSLQGEDLGGDGFLHHGRPIPIPAFPLRGSRQGRWLSNGALPSIFNRRIERRTHAIAVEPATQKKTGCLALDCQRLTARHAKTAPYQLDSTRTPFVLPGFGQCSEGGLDGFVPQSMAGNLCTDSQGTVASAGACPCEAAGEAEVVLPAGLGHLAHSCDGVLLGDSTRKELPGQFRPGMLSSNEQCERPLRRRCFMPAWFAWRRVAWISHAGEAIRSTTVGIKLPPGLPLWPVRHPWERICRAMPLPVGSRPPDFP